MNRPTRIWLTTSGVALAALCLALGLWLALPWWAVYLVAINLVTPAVYGYDKWSARRNGGRVPEKVLHGLGAAGGSPAALVAMHTFRHKTRKVAFQRVFWVIVALQVVGVVVYTL